MAFYHLETKLPGELEAMTWLSGYQKSNNEAEDFELDYFLGDLSNSYSPPSIINENETLDDISLGQYQFENPELNNESVEEFLSSVQMQLDTLSNESETTCFNLNSILRAESQIETATDLITNDPLEKKRGIKRLSSKSNDIDLENKKKHKFEKISKKQSNKEAAIRYRQKKVKEKLDLFATRDLYKKENDDLKKKIEDIQLEINFVKNILVEMLLKKV